MLVDDGRKEERRGAGETASAQGLKATFPNLGAGSSEQLCQLSRMETKEQGGLPTKEKAGLRPGGVGTNHAAHGPANIPQEGDYRCNSVCRVTAPPCHLREAPPRPQPHGGNIRIPCPSLAHDGHAQEWRIGLRVGPGSQWTDGEGLNPGLRDECSRVRGAAANIAAGMPLPSSHGPEPELLPLGCGSQWPSAGGGSVDPLPRAQAP